MLFLSTLLLLVVVPLVLCAEDYYRLLGVDKQASDKELKRAYRVLSKKYHPDKNPGNESAHQKFVEVSEAYDALSNAETRRIYDQYGHEGLTQHKRGGGHGGHDPFDLFSRFFGGGGHYGGGQRRGPNMEVRVNVPLREFYNGKDVEFSVEKQMICEECEGSGSADGEVETCGHCGGRGIVIQKHQFGPIIQQMQVVCDACGGKGNKIKHACHVCGGSRVVRKVATHNLHIERGTPRGARITFENEADASPDWVAGDMIVQLDEKTPELGADDESRVDGTFFRRKGTDLFWKEVLSLREAWLGDWSRNLTHLDGHIVHLSRRRGQVIQPNTVEAIKGEGMPIWHEDNTHKEGEYGTLHVEYKVVLPDQMEKGMEKDFWAMWEKWRKKNGVDLRKDSGRPEAGPSSPQGGKDEL
ncbi:MAG: DnaJ- protein scj1 [Geoglossum umbratile]|nr:MAG: DnaJ- protein scj1 [Geoglossum umbratile]